LEPCSHHPEEYFSTHGECVKCEAIKARSASKRSKAIIASWNRKMMEKKVAESDAIHQKKLDETDRKLRERLERMVMREAAMREAAVTNSAA
jgi:hypothetical protein